MTKEEALGILNGFKLWIAKECELREALGMAIESLSESNVHNLHSGDLISRQAAIDALKEHRALYCDNTPDAFSELPNTLKSRVDELDAAIATLVNLPSTEPKTGKMSKKKSSKDVVTVSGRTWSNTTRVIGSALNYNARVLMNAMDRIAQLERQIENIKEQKD